MVTAGWRISPKLWKIFWTLPIKHHTFTPWWMLLQDTVGVAEKLARWNESKFADNVCKICHLYTEDVQHFVVLCQPKWKLWQAGLAATEVPDEYRTPEKIWSMLMLHDISLTEIETLVKIATLYQTIWSYHWHCFHQKDVRVHEIATDRLRSQNIE
jgi:hypothetical protein